jgi:uncharacterized DUF497 family protein
MEVAFDPAKNERNIKLHGISFKRVVDFEFETALFQEDDRHDYGETRFRVIGFLDLMLHVLVMTEQEKGIRVISLRKATKGEVKRYEKETVS